MGVLDHAKADLEALMRSDEEAAAKVDEAKVADELTARQREVEAAIRAGAAEGIPDLPKAKTRSTPGEYGGSRQA